MQQIHSQSSLSRLVRQLMFVPFLHNRWLTQEVKTRLSQAITTAEQGHRGEICLVIESHLPIRSAYYQDCRERALELFGIQRVWDTEHNTGILIYINLCEHDLEIIADRGIDAKAADIWQSLIQETLPKCKTDIVDALDTLILQVGAVLNRHFPSDDPSGNELPNEVVYLK